MIIIIDYWYRLLQELLTGFALVANELFLEQIVEHNEIDCNLDA